MEITIKEDTSVLLAKMREYALYSRKSWAEIMSQEVRELAWGAFRQFQAIKPKAAALLSAAKARDFRSGRRSNILTTATSGISKASWERAKEYLGGQKSGYVRVDEAGETLRVRPAKFSAGGKFERGALLRGGRGGFRFAKSALFSHQVDGNAISKARATHPGLKRVNLRAAAAFIEIGHRIGAAQGGTLSLQWLPKAFGRRTAKERLNPGRYPVRFKGNKFYVGDSVVVGSGDQITGATISAHIPGTDRAWNKYGIWNKIVAGRVSDRDEYISKKIGEAASKAGLKLIKAVTL